MIDPKTQLQLEVDTLKSAVSDALGRLDDGSPEFAFIQDRVLRACLDARAYRKRVSKTGDSLTAKRSRHLRFQKDAPAIAASARRLAEALREHPHQMEMALAQAHLRLNAKTRGPRPTLVRGNPSSKARMTTLLKDLLEAVASELGESQRLAPGWASERHQVGPLFYPKPLTGTARPLDPLVTGLLFQLVLYLRLFTGRDPGLRMLRGREMPKIGKPNYAVACKLLKASLDVDLDPGEARRRIDGLVKRNPGIRFDGWRNAPHKKKRPTPKPAAEV